MPTDFSVKFVFEKNENKQKKVAVLAHFLTTLSAHLVRCKVQADRS